jgi:hypothetical protein
MLTFNRSGFRPLELIIGGLRMSDRMLNDIGLRKDQLECDTVKPFRYFD